MKTTLKRLRFPAAVLLLSALLMNNLVNAQEAPEQTTSTRTDATAPTTTDTTDTSLPTTDTTVPPKDAEPLPCTAYTDEADQARSDERYDPASGVLVIASGSSTYVLDRDSCKGNKLGQQRLADMEAFAEQVRKDSCKDFRDAIKENRKEDHGRTMDLEKAKVYVKEHCDR